MTSAAEKKPVLTGKAHDIVSEQVQRLSVTTFAVLGLADDAKVFSIQNRDLIALHVQLEDTVKALRELLENDEE
jgi:hypothetical protein